MKRRSELTLMLAGILVSFLYTSAAWPSTMDFSSDAQISVNMNNGLDYYKIGMDGNPTTNSAEIGYYLNYPSFYPQQTLASSGVERNGNAQVTGGNNGDQMVATNSFNYSASSGTGVFSANSSLTANLNGFTSQYSGNMMDLFFYVQTPGNYGFNMGINKLLLGNNWTQTPNARLIEGGWYSSITATLYQDSTGAAVASETYIVPLPVSVENTFDQAVPWQIELPPIDLSPLTADLSGNTFYTLYIGDYMEQYGLVTDPVADTGPDPVPEPSTILLMCTGVICLGLGLNKSRRQ